MTTNHAKAALRHSVNGAAHAPRERILNTKSGRHDAAGSMLGRIYGGKVDAGARDTDDRVRGSPAVRDA